MRSAESRVRRISCVALAAAILASASARADVTLDAQQRENLGIATQQAQRVDVPQSAAATALVLDASPLIALLGELRAAQAAAAASEAELQRAQRLHQDDNNVSLKSVDAARSQAATDASRVLTARAQIAAGWGSGIASLSSSEQSQLIEDLLHSRATLIRAEPARPSPNTARYSSVQLQTLDGAQNWPARVLGALPQTNAGNLAGALLLRADVSLPAGQILLARLQDANASLRGWKVPSGAIVRWHGGEWLYEETQPNRFVRRAITSQSLSAAEVIVDSTPLELRKVVTIGARALLDAEQNAPAEDH